MLEAPGIRVSGLEPIQRKLNAGIKKELKRPLRTLASKVKRKLASSIPRRTGRLRSGVRITIKDLSAYVGVSSPFYGRFIEYGTWKMEARYLIGGTRITKGFYSGEQKGPAAHTTEVMGPEIRQFEQEVIRAAEGLL